MKYAVFASLLAIGVIISCQKPAKTTPDPVPDPNAWLKDGLVAYYPFNGNLNDASGNNLNGEAVGNVAFGTDRAGKASSALKLNGDNGYVKVTDNAKLDLKQKMTITMEFYPETKDLYSLVGKSEVTGGKQSFHLMCNYQKAASFQVVKDGRCSSSNVLDDWSSAFADKPAPIMMNAWNCIVAIFDGTSQKIYINGTKVADMTINFGAMAGCAGTDMRFGYWWDGQHYSFKGLMDEIRIYNRALNEEEVGKLCNLTTPVPDPNAWLTDGLVAYYPFNGNLNDESGNGLNGVAVGTVSYAADRSGAASKALQLNGDNSYVTVADNVKLDLTQKMTIALEFYPETNELYSLVSKSVVAGAQQSFHLMNDYQTPAVFSVIKGGRCSTSNTIDDWSNAFASNTAVITPNAWNCIIAVFDGTSQKIYLNGVKVADKAIDFGTMAGCSGTDMRFGYWWNGQPFSYKGRMDEIRIYNRALSADEAGKLCISGTPGTDANQSLKDSLVAYYPFSGSLDDYSGNNFHGKAVGNISYTTNANGLPGRALKLNGDNSYVTVKDNAKLDITKKMTIALQFKPETANPGSLVGKSLVTGGVQSFHLMYNYLTPAVFSVIKDGRCSNSNVIDDWSNAFTDNSVPVNVNSWNCIVAIFDGNSQKIYLNGVKTSDVPITFSFMAGCNGTDLRFGYWWDGQTYSYKGSMDEIRIYNRVLTTDEIAKLCTNK